MASSLPQPIANAAETVQNAGSTGIALAKEALGVNTDNAAGVDATSPKSPEEKLEQFLQHRPDKKELVDRHVLLDSKAAPALQAKEAELQRHQLENKLEAAILHRPPSDELVNKGILEKDEAPPSD